MFPDTNVLVSAFAARGLCADLFELILLGHELILGGNVLRELRGALRRKLKLPASDSAAIVEFLLGEAAQFVESSSPIRAAVDPDDAIVLGDAVAGNAQVFVTGDARILRLTALGELRTVSPRAFWELLGARNER